MPVEVRMDIRVPESVDTDLVVDALVQVGAEVEPRGSVLVTRMRVGSVNPMMLIPESIRVAHALLSAALRDNVPEYSNGLLWRDIIRAEAHVSD